MKKNDGCCYSFYKEWKVQLDLAMPLILGVIGLFFGFFIKVSILPIVGADEKTATIIVSGMTALPVALYAKVINNYAGKIQEDKDYDEIEIKNKSITRHKKNIGRLEKKLLGQKQQSIATYKTHKKTADEIKRYLNTSNINATHRLAICEILDNVDANIFDLTISSESLYVNDYDEDNEEDKKEEKHLESTVSEKEKLVINISSENY